MASFGRYELREELGRGGMATVYRAFDPAMEREVALKVLPLEFTHDPTFVGRFLREAKIIARLDHLHIVPVYDVGQENEQPYLIMRLLAGGSLHERLASQGPFSLAQALPILDQIAAALDFAHARGIIHRDLKPSNILFDSQGQVFVSDFGIAKLLASTTAYTGTGIIGTPDYMSPEQAQATGEIDARSDVYSLGIMTYQMLTGSLPYRADTPVGLALAHVTQPVPSLRAVNPQFSEAVDGALRRALAKNPADRYSRASDFVAALRAASEGRLAPTVSAPVFEARPQPAGSVAPTSSGQPATGIAHPPRLGLALAGMGGLGAVAVCLVVFFVLVLPRMGRPAGSSGAATPTPAPSQATAGPAQLPTSIPPSAAPTQTATAPATAEGQVEIGGLSYDKHPGATVTIAGSVAGQQAQLFQSEFDEFSQATGITVQYESLPDFETAIQARVEGNNAPDIALLAQPSLLDSLARQGKVVDLNSFMSASFLQKQYAPSLLDMATVDGKVAAVWHNADIKSLV